MKKILFLTIWMIILIAGQTNVYAVTYFIDYSGGSDNNNGTSKSTPWKRAPGMLGTTDNVLAYETTHDKNGTTGAGDCFIFKGGVTWPNDCFCWVWKWGGGTGWNVGTEAVYFGVDKTWYAGASWSRPIFDAQATDISPNSKSSPASDNVMWRAYNADAGYLIIDNLEFKGMYHFDDTTENMMLNFDVGIGELKNCYFHGWGHGAVTDLGPCDGYDYCNYWDGGASAGQYVVGAFRVIATPYDDENNDIRIHHCYIDGSDSYPAPGDMANAVKGFVRHFYCNYVAHIQNALTNNFCWYVWGNTFTEIATATDLNSSNHHNMYQSYGGYGKKSYVYNNLAKNIAGGATFLWYPTDNTSFYCFNNVIYNDENATLVFSSRKLTVASNTARLFAWNNTFQLAVTNPFSGIGGSSTPYAHEIFFVKNNHVISERTGISYDPLHMDTATNIQQTNAAATAANYTAESTYPFAPQAEDALIVGKGTDLSAICSSLIDLAPSYPSVACLYDTTLGVSIDTVNHTVIYPNRTPVLHGSTWDIGAYEYIDSNMPQTPTNLKIQK